MDRSDRDAAYVEGNGGKGVPTLTPWIAVFDPDENTTAQRGMYVDYLFAQDMSTVSLSLNQGVTEVVATYRAGGEPRSAARERLALQAARLRDSLPPESRIGLSDKLHLHSTGPLQVDYEHGHLLGSAYPRVDLPTDAIVQTDLRRPSRQFQDSLAGAECEGACLTTPEHAPASPHS